LVRPAYTRPIAQKKEHHQSPTVSLVPHLFLPCSVAHQTQEENCIAKPLRPTRDIFIWTHENKNMTRIE
jgi:hypothetical protein